ncbi:AbiTii domain-containing protein [Chryseobacterium vrystaatense]|uniref:AbiTii domain-containing protein n=1 Tax=Chryseobacterium vrystaatense TaxID=307480 RepID=A0A1M5HA83_9FLAO|nr:hypothetical protein [Chryseobacterium vrystaatense]SHG12920.1 hypothetical protein SAMN02787073_3634 [Chryseobacterium vrystaatense]
MIKQLITDIAYDNISLTQALTRAKLIESKIKNKPFKDWLKNEIEGYEDLDIPEYRIIPAPIILIAEFQLGQQIKIEVNLPDSFEQQTIEVSKFHKILMPISTIEESIKNITDPEWNMKLSIEHVDIFSQLYIKNVKAQGGWIKKGHRIVARLHFQNVVDLTKQKLLDILMDLNEKFPNLENDFENTKQNNETVSNIITNNIYAPNNNLNTAAGTNISIKSEYKNDLTPVQEKTLKDLGVNEIEIQQLNTILSENNKDKPEFGKKLMGWCASVGSSLAGRGIYDALPKISEFVTQLM